MKYKPIKLGIAALVLTVFGTGSIWGGEITSDSSQKSYDVHLSLRQATVQTFSEAFSEETGVLFSYESGIAGKNFGNVEIDAENLPLESILDPVFAGRKGFSYKIVNSTVIIFWSDNPQTSVIRGTVTDASGEPMIGAGILIKGTTGGTVTDMDGNETTTTVQTTETDPAYSLTDSPLSEAYSSKDATLVLTGGDDGSIKISVSKEGATETKTVVAGDSLQTALDELGYVVGEHTTYDIRADFGLLCRLVGADGAACRYG